MNYYEHHIGDYIKATAHLSMLEDAAYRRLIDAYYTKEAPLPAERKACHRLARATSKPERDAVDTVLDEFFTLADDGWHQSRCDEEIAKYIEKRPAAEEKRENDKERQRRARERRKQLFEELSNRGINMPWNATTEMLQVELSRVTSGDMSQQVTEPVTRDNTATQSPVPSPQSPDIKESTALSGKPDPAQAQARKKLSEECAEVLAFLNEKTGRNYQPVKANIQLIAARLREGATVVQLRQVIAKKCREWRDDPKQEIYLRPKTLFNATNFANYQGELAA